MDQSISATWRFSEDVVGRLVCCRPPQFLLRESFLSSPQEQPKSETAFENRDAHIVQSFHVRERPSSSFHDTEKYNFLRLLTSTQYLYLRLVHNVVLYLGFFDTEKRYLRKKEKYSPPRELYSFPSRECNSLTWNLFNLVSNNRLGNLRNLFCNQQGISCSTWFSTNLTYPHIVTQGPQHTLVYKQVCGKVRWVPHLK